MGAPRPRHPVRITPEPGWRNWQTQRTQNPPRATSWGFDPPSRHHQQPKSLTPTPSQCVLSHVTASNGAERHTGLMRPPAALTSVLTAILLMLSTFPSACQMLCDLGRPAAHPRTQLIDSNSMAADGNCCSASTTASAPHSCGHQSLPKQPALAAEQISVPHHSRSTWATLARGPFSTAPGAVSPSIPARAPPHRQTASPISLHTISRV